MKLFYCKKKKSLQSNEIFFMLNFHCFVDFSSFKNFFIRLKQVRKNKQNNKKARQWNK